MHALNEENCNLMSVLLKTSLLLLMHTLAVAFAVFFLWLQQQHYAAIQHAAVVEIQSGSAFLLLPLLLPLVMLLGLALLRHSREGG